MLENLPLIPAARAGCGSCSTLIFMLRFVTAIVGAVIAVVSAAATSPPPEDTWPGFRGHGMSGIAPGKAIPEQWTTTENVRWKTEVPGQGWSSPIVWGDTVFVTSGISGKPFKQPTPGLYGNDYIAELSAQGLSGEEIRKKTRERDNEAPEESDDIRYMVYALDARTGKIKWEQEAIKAALWWPAPEEHLRLGNTRDGRRAPLRIVRPERGIVLLQPGRQAALEEAVAAAADLPRFRHGLVTDGVRRSSLPTPRQRS